MDYNRLYSKTAGFISCPHSSFQRQLRKTSPWSQIWKKAKLPRAKVLFISGPQQSQLFILFPRWLSCLCISQFCYSMQSGKPSCVGWPGATGKGWIYHKFIQGVYIQPGTNKYLITEPKKYRSFLSFERILWLRY